MELEDAARVGLPPAVDELVVVADDEEPAIRPGEHVHERQLRPVEILEFVHQHVVEPPLDEGPVRGIGEHVGDGEVDLVVEGLESRRGLGAHVLRVGGRERDGDDGRVGDALDLDVDLGDGLERCPDPGQSLHEAADRVAASPWLQIAEGDAGGLHGPGHERAERAAVVVEREARPQDLALVPVAEGIEGGAVDARRAFGGGRAGTSPADGASVRRRAEAARGADAEGGEALFELLRRLAVEGEHQDAGRVGAAIDELDDAAHQGLRLARAGRREDARGAVTVFDGGALGVVELRRIGAGGRARRRPGRPGRVGGGRRLEHLRAAGKRAGGSRLAQQAADVLEVEGAGLADAEAARRQHALTEREPDAERQATADERVDESAAARLLPARRTRRRCHSRTRARRAGRHRAAVGRDRRDRRSSRAARRSVRRGRPPPLAARGRGGSRRRRTRVWDRPTPSPEGRQYAGRRIACRSRCS